MAVSSALKLRITILHEPQGLRDFGSLSSGGDIGRFPSLTQNKVPTATAAALFGGQR